MQNTSLWRDAPTSVHCAAEGAACDQVSLSQQPCAASWDQQQVVLP